MADPFTCGDARKRAAMARHAAETWHGVVTERTAFAERYEAEGRAQDARAARSCVELAEQSVDFHLEQAEAYERVARGEDAYPAHLFVVAPLDSARELLRLRHEVSRLTKDLEELRG